MWLECRRTTCNLFGYYHESLELKNSKMCLRTTIFTNTTRRARQAMLERVQLELRVGHMYTKNWQDRAVEWWSGQNVRDFSRSKPF